jgi:hypothetical protein
MSGFSAYSKTAGSNTMYFPENQAPSTVNDGARSFQADARYEKENNEWFDWGHTPTRTGNTTFTVAGDLTALYTANRRIKCTDSSDIYGVILSSTYSAPDTTVTISSDSGNLSASLTAVALACATRNSLPTNLGRKGSDVASASTINLSAAGGDFCDVTGTTTVTAITSEVAGVERTVRFTGALTLTHNGTSLILPGSVNITTANGDKAVFRSLGSGNWLCVCYIDAAGGNTIIQRQGADMASASTVDLSTATGDFVNITGTTTITALGTCRAGIKKTLVFLGVLTFTHNGSSLKLPGNANITTAANDSAEMLSLGSGNWLCVNYNYASGSVSPFVDSTAIVVGSSDGSKQLRLEVDGLTTSTTRVWTATDRDVNIGAGTVWEYITSLTASNSTTLSFNGLSSTYIAYMFVISNIKPATDNTNLLFRTSTNNGSSYDSSAGNYKWSNWALAANDTNNQRSDANGTSIEVGNSIGNDTNEHISGRLFVHNPGDTNYCNFSFQTSYQNATPTFIAEVGSGMRTSTTAINGVQFFFSSGNITSGKIHLYGLRASS